MWIIQNKQFSITIIQNSIYLKIQWILVKSRNKNVFFKFQMW